MNQLAKIIIIYTSMAILLIIGFGLWNYFTSYQYLVLQVPEERQEYVKLYKATRGEGDLVKSEGEIEIEFNTDLKLDRGTYVAEYSQEGFELSRRDIFLDKEIVNVTFDYQINTPALELIFEQSKQDIHNSLEESYPGMLSRYKIAKEGVYDDGSWYGAILETIVDTSLQRDTVRIVLRNEAGIWRVAAKPYITISQAEYPEIPESVLDEINIIIEDRTPVSY